MMVMLRTICSGMLYGLLFMVLSLRSGGMAQAASSCATALQDYRVAQQAYQDGLLDPAIAGFEAYLQQCPQGLQAPQAHYFLGVILHKRQRYAQALAQAQRALALAGQTELHAYALLLAGQSALQLNQHEEARTYLQQAEVADVSADALSAVRYWLGELAVRQKHYDEALRSYQRVVQAQEDTPYAVPAYYALGWLYRQRGEAAAALEAFDALLARAPKDKRAWQTRLARADLLREVGRLEEAAVAFAELAQEAPLNMRDEALFGWAELAYQLKQYPAANTAYQRLLAEHPRSKRAPASLYGLGWVALRQQQCKAAVQPWEDLLRQHPDTEHALDVHYQLGVCYVQLEQPDAARRHWQTVLEASPHAYPDVWHRLAALAVQEQRYDDAIRYYTHLLATASADEALRFHAILGESYAALGQEDQALEHWQKVLAGSHDFARRPQALYRVGRIFATRGDWEQATPLLRQLWDAFSQFPERTQVAFYLAQAYSAAQQCDQALPFYEAIIRATTEHAQRATLRQAHAVCLFTLGRYAAVVERLAPQLDAAAAEAVTPQALYILAQASIQLQQSFAALKPFMMLHERFPEHALTIETMPSLAAGLERESRPEEALTIWKTYLQRLANDNDDAARARLHLHVGRLAFRLGQLDATLDFLAPARNAALAVVADEALFWSAEVYFKQQQWAVALQRYQQLIDRTDAVAEHKWDAVAQLRLGTIYEYQHEWEQALQAYEALLGMTSNTALLVSARQRIDAIEAGRVFKPLAPPAPHSKG